MTDARVVLVTVPNEAAGVSLVSALLEAELVACGNLIPGIRSIYRWKGEICDDHEQLLILKTTSTALQALTAKVVELHPYECPEVIALPITDGHSDYLSWIAQNVGSQRIS
tara:strand:- start:226 stop:558 length:333 start_codon:yes stop_codon:yes gene_type:complete